MELSLYPELVAGAWHGQGLAAAGAAAAAAVGGDSPQEKQVERVWAGLSCSRPTRFLVKVLDRVCNWAQRCSAAMQP
jgi:hypothetical protein